MSIQENRRGTDSDGTMKVCVCFQIVPDLSLASDSQLPESPGEMPSGLYPRIFDTYDESALEQALRLKEQGAAVLTGVTLSPEPDRRRLEALFALGFDRIIRLDGTLEPFSARRKARILAAATADSDLILTGRQSGLAGTRMTPRFLAEELGIPYVDDVFSLQRTETGVVFHAAGGGVCSSGTITAPAVVMVGEGGWLRIPTLRARMSVKGKEAEVQAAQAPPPALPNDELPLALHRPAPRGECRMLSGSTNQIVSQLLMILRKAEQPRSEKKPDKKLRPSYGGALLAEYPLSRTEPAKMSLPNESWLRDYAETTDADVDDLSHAGTVLVAGRGLGGGEAAALLNSLAERAGAKTAATRAAVMSGWFPLGSLVGVSGVSLHGRVALVLGASGAAAFTAGLEDCELVIAVNTDPEAPVFRHADIGIAGDCVEILKELNAQWTSLS